MVIPFLTRQLPGPATTIGSPQPATEFVTLWPPPGQRRRPECLFRAASGTTATEQSGEHIAGSARVLPGQPLSLTVTNSACPAWWPGNQSWDERRPCPRAMCAFRAFTCGSCAGRTPGAARQPTLIRRFTPPRQSRLGRKTYCRCSFVPLGAPVMDREAVLSRRARSNRAVADIGAPTLAPAVNQEPSTGARVSVWLPGWLPVAEHSS